MYSTKPEIQAISSNEITESDYTEWSHSFLQQKQTFAIRTDEAWTHDIPVEPPDPPPESLSAAEALDWPVGKAGVDFRPHLYQKEVGYVLCDSGSQVSAYPPEPGDQPVKNRFLKAANGTKIQCYGVKEVVIKLNRKQIKFNVIKADVESPILGWDFFRQKKIDFRWNDFGDITLYDKISNIQVVLNYKPVPLEKSLRLTSLSLVEEEFGPQTDPQPEHRNRHPNLQAEVAAVEDLGIEEGEENINVIPDGPYKDLLQKYPDLLKQNFNELSTKTGVVHRIQTNSDRPVKIKPRRLLPGSPKAQKAKEAWDQLLRLGIVERVDPAKTNTYSSPLHFVWKSDGSIRPVGDYRSLNAQTELDQFPLPHLRDFAHNMAGCKIFSRCDLRKAFHQIIIDERDRFRTGVSTPWGMFQFKRLSMGLKNSGQAFQRLVQHVIGDIPGVFCYLDDLLLFSKNEADHLVLVDKVFQKLNEAGLTLALDKCLFGVKELDYLGYHVTAEGLAPIKKKVTALQEFPAPTKQKELLAFLGAINYYRASLPNLAKSDSANPEAVSSEFRSPATVLDPLYKLATCNIKKTKGNTFKDIWESSDRLKEAFSDAKKLLENAIILNFPDPTAPLALSTDASKFHLGASLDQWVDGHWRPLGLWSKSLRPEQTRYTTYNRELLAIKYSLRHFINEINGRRLVVYSDHKPLIGTWQNPNLQEHDTVALNAINEIAQWVDEIRHKPGRDLLVPDLLSRPPQNLAKAYRMPDKLDPKSTVLDPKSTGTSPQYVAPESTLAALEEVAINVISPAQIAKDQAECPIVKNHKLGIMPKGVQMGTVSISDVPLYCEVSQPGNPRPLIPEQSRSLILNLLHHQDHPSPRETLRRVSRQYYWPKQSTEVTQFCKTCHPCQVAKQSRTVNPGTSLFEVPDKRFSSIHLDVVGPLPESEGFRYLLSVFDRTSRWLEVFKMRQATSEECCSAFMSWASRYGVPSVAISDNGNTFVANLYKDIMRTFGVKVNFTPAYHAATNGAVERRHQTIKNSLKAALVDMGHTHGKNWVKALPWVLMAKRAQVQPDLDASASQLVFGKSISLPGQLLGHPGPPLTNLQTKKLLDQLYQLENKPAIQTSATVNPIDISFTDKATHVYVKNEDTTGLATKFLGPFLIVSRPSRTQVEVKVGVYANGEARTVIYHWSSCKIAHLRPGAEEGQRPQLGRPKTSPRPDPPTSDDTLTQKQSQNVVSGSQTTQPVESPKNKQTDPDPSPQLSNEQDRENSKRRQPRRSTRNKNPQYIDSIVNPA